MLVIKLGGSRGIDTEAFLADLAAVVRGGEQVVFVHGGNKELDDLCEQLGIPVRQVTSATGQVSRFTDAETMDAFLMAYAGRINKRLVEKLQALGVNAVGLTAMDGRIASGRRKASIRIVEDGKAKMLHGDYAGSIETIDPTLAAPARREWLLARPHAARHQHRWRGDQCGRRQAGDGARRRARRGRAAHLLEHTRPPRRCQ